MPKTIYGLAKVLKLAVALCNALEALAPGIRQFVPEDKKEDFDQAVSVIMAGCEVLRAINYLDGWSGTNPPFGTG